MHGCMSVLHSYVSMYVPKIRIDKNNHTFTHLLLAGRAYLKLICFCVQKRKELVVKAACAQKICKLRWWESCGGGGDDDDDQRIESCKLVIYIVLLTHTTWVVLSCART
jgi:hypothetical protein